MIEPAPSELHAVTALTKANLYFDGKVVSHTLLTAEGKKKTLGLIFAGQYHFGTEKAEIMQITAGSCEVTLDGVEATQCYGPGEGFAVAANSGFTIRVPDGVCEYICSFID